jgi:hypothetical protein
MATTPPVVLVRYRYWAKPRKSRRFPDGDTHCSEMRATLVGDRVRFTGGKHGAHEVAADDAKRVNAHWLGYVRATYGEGAVPARIPKRVLAAGALTDGGGRFAGRA